MSLLGDGCWLVYLQRESSERIQLHHKAVTYKHMDELLSSASWLEGCGIWECGMWDDSYLLRVLDLLAAVVCEKIHKGLPHRASRTLLMGDQIKMSGETDPTNGDAAKLLKAQILSNGTAR